MHTNHVVEINCNLTTFQRQKIQQTTFKWMVEVENVLDISNTFLQELMSR